MDAIVIGAGHNGLVAANLLADAGWDVVVFEAEPLPGGAVRSAELTLPGFTHDVFSAFYPLGFASPAMRDLELESWGLRWRRAPLVLANPLPDGRCAALSTDIDETARSLDSFAPGDGDAWRELYAMWERLGDTLLDVVLRPFPPLRAGLRLAAQTNRDLGRFLRFLMLPVRRLAEERFRGDGAGLLLAGNALHADLAPEQPLGGMFAWLLASLGQQVGFPVPEGGSGRLTDALVRRLEAAGGTVRCGMPVERVVVRDGRATGVVTADGIEHHARRSVLADVGAPALYLGLVGEDHLPSRVADDLRRFQWDTATVKVDWALRAPIPWRNEEARRAGTIHLAAGMDHLTAGMAQMAMGIIPAAPFQVMGQLTTADPTRSPPGTETAWSYTHVPHHVRGDAGGDLTGAWDEREAAIFVERMEAEIERYAPGFRDLVEARHVLTPAGFEQRDRSLVGGAINGGTAQLHQQLIFRPTPGLGRPETPIAGLFLASSSAHPGGGVHGAPGSNAARAALLHARVGRAARFTTIAAGAALAAGMTRRRLLGRSQP